MLRLSSVIAALEERGGSLDYHEHGMVWIDGPDAGCYVRAKDVLRIELYYRRKDEVWSRVVLANPDGGTTEYVDKRRPKSVRAALDKAQREAIGTLLDELKARFSNLIRQG